MNATGKPGEQAAEKFRRVAHHIDSGAGLSAADRLARLKEAMREADEARGLLEDEVIAAEDEAQDGHGAGADGEGDS